MEKYNPLQLVKIVIIRAVLSKEKLESKLTQYAVGQKVTMIRQYADELVSMRKAVLEGSPEHEAWLERQEELASSKQPASNTASLLTKLEAAEKRIAALEAEKAEAAKPKK